MLPAFEPNGSINVMVESPCGSGVKFKYAPEHDLITVSHPLPAGLTYPYDGGFISSTLAPDGDPLAAFIVWDGTSFPGVLIRCRPIGILRVEQTNAESKRREPYDRVAVLPVKVPRHDGVKSVLDLPQRMRAELEQFFLQAVAFEGKELKLLGWGGPDDADVVIRRAETVYADGNSLAHARHPRS